MADAKCGRMFLYYMPNEDTPFCASWDMGGSRQELKTLIEEEGAELAVLTHAQAHEFYAKFGCLFHIPRSAVTIETPGVVKAYYPQ